MTDEEKTIAAAEQKSLELLFDYTKFHIGLYLTLTASYVTAATAKINNEQLLDIDTDLAKVAVLMFMVAGLAGGVIASSLTQSTAGSTKRFLDRRIGPWDVKFLHCKGRYWTYLEHTAFWIGLILAALSFRLEASPSTGGDFKLESPDIKAGGTMAKKFEFSGSGFDCAGENRSPALKWSGAPKDAKSYAITVYDPGTPTSSGWWHWLVVNIPAGTTELKADAGAVGGANLPKGASHVRIDFGVAGWGGVCPPQGDKPHRYIFTVHALKTEKLEIPVDATAALVGLEVEKNSVGKATFMAKYGRKK